MVCAFLVESLYRFVALVPEVRPRVHSLLRAHLPVRLRSMSARASQSKYMQWLTVAPDLCSFVFLARLRWHWRSGMRRTG